VFCCVATDAFVSGGVFFIKNTIKITCYSLYNINVWAVHAARIGWRTYFSHGHWKQQHESIIFSQLKVDFIDGLQYLRLMYRANEKSPNMRKMVSFSTKPALWAPLL
jgi:hypothetical protein